MHGLRNLLVDFTFNSCSCLCVFAACLGFLFIESTAPIPHGQELFLNYQPGYWRDYSSLKLTVCQKCGDGKPYPEKNNSILICDTPKCDREYHQKCVTPAIKEIPKGKWNCPHCVANKK